MIRVTGWVLLTFYAIALAWWLIAATDWDAVLRFIAPTAFEARSVEEIIEGNRAH